MAGESFDFETRRTGGTVVAALSGDLDMAASLRLEPQLERVTGTGGVQELVLDMGEVRFMDSSGLGLLLANSERLRAAGIGFRVANPSPAVRRILELTDATAGLDISPAVPGQG